MAFALLFFPRWGVNACIPSFILIPLGAWIYGRRIGLILILLSIPFQHLLSSYLYADLLDYYQYVLIGYITLIMLVYLAGTLKEQLAVIKKLSTNLDSTVAARNQELKSLSTDLLNQSESFRNTVGQKLHDEIGQELTGIQLFLSALSEQYQNENKAPPTELADMEAKSKEVHTYIRQAARSIFPVRLSAIGLKAALEELINFIGQTYSLKTSLIYLCQTQALLKTERLHIYRIAQETLLYLLKHSNPSRITVLVDIKEASAMLQITHDGRSISKKMRSASEMSLIQYRLNHLNGQVVISLHESVERIQYICTVHNQAHTSEK